MSKDRERIIDYLETFLEDVFTELSPGLFMTINIYVMKRIGKRLPEAIIDSPKDVYEVLISLTSESSIKVLDASISRFLKRKGISIEGNVLGNLKYGNNSAIINVSRIYVGKEVQVVKS